MWSHVVVSAAEMNVHVKEHGKTALGAFGSKMEPN